MIGQKKIVLKSFSFTEYDLNSFTAIGCLHMYDYMQLLKTFLFDCEAKDFLPLLSSFVRIPQKKQERYQAKPDCYRHKGIDINKEIFL